MSAFSSKSQKVYFRGGFVVQLLKLFHLHPCLAAGKRWGYFLYGKSSNFPGNWSQITSNLWSHPYRCRWLQSNAEFIFVRLKFFVLVELIWTLPRRGLHLDLHRLAWTDRRACLYLFLKVVKQYNSWPIFSFCSSGHNYRFFHSLPSTWLRRVLSSSTGARGFNSKKCAIRLEIGSFLSSFGDQGLPLPIIILHLYLIYRKGYKRLFSPLSEFIDH